MILDILKMPIGSKALIVGMSQSHGEELADHARHLCKIIHGKETIQIEGCGPDAPLRGRGRIFVDHAVRINENIVNAMDTQEGS
jgi:hypothetical protein